MRLKVVADMHIPYLKGMLEPWAEVIYLPAKKIQNAVIQDADALFIRTRTRCNADLLDNTKVSFIATATIGYDHIDTMYCKEKGIQWHNAPGSNSSSVVQYFMSAILSYSGQYDYTLQGKTIGIIGVGHVGTKIAKTAQLLGMHTMLNDPPRKETEQNNEFCSLQEIVEKADIITFHTPLNREGKYKTFHLAEENFFQSLKQKPLIINTARGEVIDTQRLTEAHNTGKIRDMIIDCWENEPNTDKHILEKSFLSTPHIAGYSADGKANATSMSLKSFFRHFRISGGNSSISLPHPANGEIRYISLPDAVLNTYNPKTDSENLKRDPKLFEFFRENYPVRREPTAFDLKGTPEDMKNKMKEIGFHVL